MLSWPSFSVCSNKFQFLHSFRMVKMTAGRRKIPMRKIENRFHCSATFSKRWKSLIRNASELSTLCEGQPALVFYSPGGSPFSFGTPNVNSVIDRFLNNNTEGETSCILDEIQKASLRNLNQQLDELNDQLDVAKKRGEEFKKKNERNEYHHLLNSDLHEVGLQDLENLMGVEARKLFSNRSDELSRSSSSTMAPNHNMCGPFGASIQYMTNCSNELVGSSSTFMAQPFEKFAGPSVPNELFPTANSVVNPNLNRFFGSLCPNGKEKSYEMIGSSSSQIHNIHASAPNVTHGLNQQTRSLLTLIPSSPQVYSLSTDSRAVNQTGRLIGSSASSPTPNLHGFGGPCAQNQKDQYMEWMLGPSLALNQGLYFNSSSQNANSRFAALVMGSPSLYAASTPNGIVGPSVPDLPNQNIDMIRPSSSSFVAPNLGGCVAARALNGIVGPSVLDLPNQNIDMIWPSSSSFVAPNLGGYVDPSVWDSTH